MKLLVGMLSCGENERERAIDALKRQSFRNWDFFEIRDRPNREAHLALYDTFMSSRADCYLKLDADMVLKADVLGRLVEQTRAQDVTIVPVDDWPSQHQIPGMLVFSNVCRWVDKGDPVNVDIAPLSRGSRMIQGKRWVDHMPDPHEFQAFRYGVHKAVKMLQPAMQENLAKLKLHLAVLKGIWKFRHLDRRRDLMMLGAESVFSGLHDELLGDYAGAGARRVFDSVRHDDASCYAQYWDDEAVAEQRALTLAQSFKGRLR